MKFVKKEDLKIKDGYFVDNEGNIVVVDPELVEQINNFETCYQKKAWYDRQPDYNPGPKFKEFKRRSGIFDSKSMLDLVVETPKLDEAIDDAMALMDELDSLKARDDMQEIADMFPELFEMVESDDIIVGDYNTIVRVDTPCLGDPLKWDRKFLVECCAYMANIEVDLDEQSK